MKTILVVDDESKIVQLVRDYLEHAGFSVHYAQDGKTALSKARTEKPDLIILDLGLPDLDGLDVTRELRKSSNAPIIMLTARAEETDKLIGLELGADDYITKPFSPKELAARIKALLRRAEQRDTPSQPYAYGALTLDPSRHEVRLGDTEVALTAKEFGLLEQLLRNTGRVLTRDVLLNAVWGYDYHGTTRTVDVHIRRLKQKLPLLDDAVVSIKSLGYKLRDFDE